MINCKSHLDRPAYAHITWGRNTSQSANLCRECADEVWNKSQNQIKAGICFWIQTEPQGNK